MVNLITALGRLAELEDAISDLYIWLSEVYDDVPEVSGRLFQLGMQETRHSALIRYHRRLAMRGSEAMCSVDLDENELDRLLAIVATVRRAPGRPHLGQVLELAIEVEGSAAERLHHALAREVGGVIAEAAAMLARDDERHAEMIARLERGLAPHTSSRQGATAVLGFNHEANGFAVRATV